MDMIFEPRLSRAPAKAYAVEFRAFGIEDDAVSCGTARAGPSSRAPCISTMTSFACMCFPDVFDGGRGEVLCAVLLCPRMPGHPRELDSTTGRAREAASMPVVSSARQCHRQDEAASPPPFHESSVAPTSAGISGIFLKTAALRCSSRSGTNTNAMKCRRPAWQRQHQGSRARDQEMM